MTANNSQLPGGALIIEAEGLRKTFTVKTGWAEMKSGAKPSPQRESVVEAVRDLDMTVRSGEIFGFLGPNGAGKSTTVRMLATLLRPDGGRATVAGADLLREPARIRERLGYVSQAGGIDGQATARRNLVLQARLHGLAAPNARARADTLLERFGLSSVADRSGRTLSGGQQRRLALALGLVHEPPLLMLDEPSTGLDPHARALLWEEIRRLNATGTTVLLTTHYLEEADALCNRVAIIDGGRIVAEGSPITLKQSVLGDVVTLRPNGDGDRAESVVRGLSFVREVRPDGEALRAYVDDGEQAVPALLRLLGEQGIAVDRVGLMRPSLDDVFLQKTGRSLEKE